MAEQDSQKTTGAPKGGRPEMTARKRISASNATAYVLLTIGAVIAINLIATRVFGRIDLTENKVYTLSPASRDVVKNLPDYLTVKAYISKDLPPELTTVSRYTRDLLDEYRTYSKGKLRFEAIDPGADKKIAEEANQCGVRPLQIQVLRSQKFEVGSYFMGLCFNYQGKTESIAEVTQQEGLEYQVSSIIKRMTQRKRKVAFTTGHGESDLNQGFTMLKHDIEREFDTTTVNPSSASIGDDVDAIVVAGPKQPLDDKARREIDAYLLKGHGAIFLADGMVLQAPRGGMPDMGAQPKIGQANETGLNELLEKYGFKIGQDFVLDKQNVPGPVEIGGRRMLRNRPEFVGVKVEDDVKDLTVMAGVNILVFPFPSSVELTGPLAGGKPSAGKLWTLAQTSPDAWKQTGFYFYAPAGEVEEGKEKGRFGLAYAYQGPLHSAFAPTAAPGMSGGDTPGADSKQPVRLVVVGDSDFANDEYLQFARYLPFYQGGAQMLFNAISWALEDETLTPVRTKNIGVRPITVDSDAKVALVKVINIACVPLAFIGFGLVRWRLRRARRSSQTL
jgi:gliding-associated putative ABC transporter substrate-binding component GldG